MNKWINRMNKWITLNNNGRMNKQWSVIIRIIEPFSNDDSYQSNKSRTNILSGRRVPREESPGGNLIKSM